jgi:gamma-glutamylcyclotransferase (GGCT)/AIG2-like uncharacterized protein YtfP
MGHLVFVYGTLMQGYGNHRLLENSRFVAQATTSAPATLVNVGWFPAITTLDAGPCPVAGEVYEVNAETLANLDRLEGVPSLYTRERVTVDAEDEHHAGTVEVWTYVFARDDEDGLTPIASGDYRDVRAPKSMRIPNRW